MKNKSTKILSFILPIISIACIFIVWWVASFSIDNQYILPSIKETFIALFSLLKSGEFYACYFSTLLRGIIAFCLSFSLAFIVAVLSKKYSAFEKFIKPVITIIRALPTIAVVLLLLVWTNSKIAPIIVTMLVVFPTLYNDIKLSLDEISKEQLLMCKVFNVPQKTVLFKIELPQIAPSLFLSIGAGISLNLKLMVAAEVLSNTALSLGYLLNTSKVYLEIATMIALVLSVVITGIVIEAVFNFISRKVSLWK